MSLIEQYITRVTEDKRGTHYYKNIDKGNLITLAIFLPVFILAIVYIFGLNIFSDSFLWAYLGAILLSSFVYWWLFELVTRVYKLRNGATLISALLIYFISGVILINVIPFEIKTIPYLFFLLSAMYGLWSLDIIPNQIIKNKLKQGELVLTQDKRLVLPNEATVYARAEALDAQKTKLEILGYFRAIEFKNFSSNIDYAVLVLKDRLLFIIIGLQSMVDFGAGIIEKGRFLSSEELESSPKIQITGMANDEKAPSFTSETQMHDEQMTRSAIIAMSHVSETEILSKSKGNFALLNKDIIKITLSKENSSLFRAKYGPQGINTAFGNMKIEVIGDNKPRKFSLASRGLVNFNTYKSILSQTLKDKITS